MVEPKSYQEQLAGLGTGGEVLGYALDAKVRVIDFIANETQPLWEPVGFTVTLHSIDNRRALP